MDFWATEAGRQLAADRERVEAVLNKLSAASGELKQNQSARLEQLQRAAIELAMTIATRLLHEQIVSGDFAIEAKVRDMIAQLGDEAPVAIRLNPADLDLLTARLGGKPLAIGRDDPRFLADLELGRGDCRVEGREAVLLSEVTQELQEIRDELLRSLGHARS